MYRTLSWASSDAYKDAQRDARDDAERCDIHPDREAVRHRTGQTMPSDPGASRTVHIYECAECAEEHDYYASLADDDLD